MEEQKTISVLLICAYPKKYRLVMKQLAQENWKVSAVGNVKKALQMIMQKPPTHVFVSANTPGIALLKIAKIISSTFNLPVVLFAEQQDFQTSKALRESKWPHTIQSGISANSIRNKIRAISGEDVSSAEKEDGVKRFSSTNNKQTGAGLIKIEGKLKANSQSADGITEHGSDSVESFESEDSEDFGFQAKANRQMTDDLNSLNEGWDSEDMTMSSDDLAGDDEVVSLDDEDNGLFDANSDSEEVSDLLESFDEDGDMLEAKDTPYTGKKKKEYTMEQLSVEIHNELNNKSAPSSAKKKNPKTITEIAGEIESVQAKSEQRVAPLKSQTPIQAEKDLENEILAEEKVISIAKAKQPQSKNPEEEFDLELRQELPYSLKPAEIIPDKIKGVVEKSLFKIVNPSSVVQKEVDVTSDFVAFYMQSAEFAGIIYLAVGKNNAIASGIVGPYMKALTEILKAEKIEAYVHRPVAVHVNPVDIKGWMKKNTSFYCTAVHNEEEVLLGFVSDTEVQPVFEDSEYKGMFHVDISHFPVSYPMSMDLYVYLPLNQKAVRYVAKEGYMDKKQKDRLMKHKHSAFHILNEDILAVRDFFVKLYTKKKVVA